MMLSVGEKNCLKISNLRGGVFQTGQFEGKSDLVNLRIIQPVQNGGRGILDQLI